jgi:hypothetical protein
MKSTSFDQNIAEQSKASKPLIKSMKKVSKAQFLSYVDLTASFR